MIRREAGNAKAYEALNACGYAVGVLIAPYNLSVRLLLSLWPASPWRESNTRVATIFSTESLRPVGIDTEQAMVDMGKLSIKPFLLSNPLGRAIDTTLIFYDYTKNAIAGNFPDAAAPAANIVYGKYMEEAAWMTMKVETTGRVAAVTSDIVGNLIDAYAKEVKKHDQNP